MSIHELAGYYGRSVEPFPGKEVAKSSLVSGMTVIVDELPIDGVAVEEIDFFEESPDLVKHVCVVV